MTVSFLRPSATRGSHAPAALRDMIFIPFRTDDPSLGNFDLVACGYALAEGSGWDRPARLFGRSPDPISRGKR